MLKTENLKATMDFIDFKKARRGLLRKILKAYGIPETIVELTAGMYTGTEAKAVTADGITKAFDIPAGVLQGDTLAPYLFIIVIDYIMNIAIDGDNSEYRFTFRPTSSRRIGSRELANMNFTDDVSLITDTAEGAGLRREHTLWD